MTTPTSGVRRATGRGVSRAGWAGSLLALACVIGRPMNAQEFEGAGFQRLRDAYHQLFLAYPFDRVPEGALERAWLALARQPSRTANLASGSWTPAGPNSLFLADGFFSSSPQADAGRVDDIAISPISANNVFLASPGGGIWRSTTGGDSWSPVSDQFCSLRMGAVSVDPVNPSLVYAGVYNSTGSTFCALFRSTDGGSAWASTGTGGFSSWTGGVTHIHIDPATAGTTNATTIVLAATFGILRSANSGASWAFPLMGYSPSVVALPTTPNVLFTGLVDLNNTTRNGLYRSTDNGATWVLVGSAPPNFTGVGRFQLAVSPASPTTVWLIGGKQSDDRLAGLWRFDNTTQQFTTLAAAGVYTGESRGDFGTQATYDLVLAVDPVDPSLLYAGGVRLFRSTTGGASFTQMAQNIHCDWHTLVIDPRNPRRLIGGSDGGIFISTDGGATWLARNNNLAITQYYPGISIHPTDGTMILAGSQDNGSHLSNGTSLWSGVSGGDGGFAAINYNNPGTVWTTTQWTPGSGGAILRRSPDVNAGFVVSRRTGIVGSDRALFIPPLLMDPVTPTTLYYGTQRLYRTVNEGVLWTPVSGDLTRGAGAISTIAVAKSNPAMIYVGTSDGNMQVSRDGGATFTLSNAGLPNRSFTRLVVDVTDPNRAVVTASGFQAGHVFLTTNGGTSWTNISGALVDAPLRAVVMIPGNPNHFFVGGDLGVFESEDAGATWFRMPQGMPNVLVQDLAYNASLQLLVAATYGRGMFTYSLANPAAVLRGDVNRDGRVDAFDALLIQQALVGIAMAPGMTSLPHGDTNCNGTLEAADALIVLRQAVGLVTAGACVGTNR